MHRTMWSKIFACTHSLIWMLCSRLLFEFFLYTGAREGEVMHAEWADLLQDSQIFLIREKKRWGFKPKGRKERQVRILTASPLNCW